jgi:hypothetical protein
MWRTHSCDALVRAVSRLRTPEVTEFGLSRVAISSTRGRAAARLDRLTIGPQVINLPHNAWVTSCSLTVRNAGVTSGVRRLLSTPARVWYAERRQKCRRGTPECVRHVGMAWLFPDGYLAVTE